ncbi:MAG: hypothetical protein ACI8S6_001380 [Myxococcota bacterium]|jgi:hypothetical protein
MMRLVVLSLIGTLGVGVLLRSRGCAAPDSVSG